MSGGHGPKDARSRILNAMQSAEDITPSRQPSDSESAAAPPSAGSAEIDLECARLPLTDLGNAERFVLRHGDDFWYVPEWGWQAWDGRRWSSAQADGQVARAVQDTVKAIADEARAWARSGQDEFVKSSRSRDLAYKSDKIRNWGIASQTNAHISCIARLAQPHLQAAPTEFDSDPMVLNVLNGILRFARTDTGDYVSFKAHDRADKITRLAPVEYDPEAICPAYDAMLERVQPDPAVRRHIHSWGGLSLTGDVSPQRMVFWYGKGGNGKSTLLDAWAHVAGNYATTIAAESFLNQGRTRRGSDATPDLADLVGVRMLKTSEPERGAKLAEALIKTATGDETLKVRFLNKEFFPLRGSVKQTAIAH